MDASASTALVVSASRATWFATHASHPNIVRVLGVHHVATGPRLMLEQVSGRDLGALIDAAFPDRLPLPELLAVARDCARGLHFLHELRDAKGTAVRLIHGTLAPALVTVGFDGVARVGGLERLCGVRGVPAADPGYAAPEQRADGAAIDRRADVFALAAILLRAATGLALRDGVMPVPTSQAVPYVPQSIEDVLRKALAPDPARRFATAEALRAALERCVVDEGLAAGPDRVAHMVSRYLPDVPIAPPRPELPPRPDHSLWAAGGAAPVPRWMPAESVVDTRAPASGDPFDVISVAVPRPPMVTPGPPLRSNVPAAAPVAPTMTVAALDEATAIAPVPLPPPGSAPPALPPPALMMALPPPVAAPPPGPPPLAAPAMMMALPPPPRRPLWRDPLFLVGGALLLFFATLVVTYLASG